MAVPQPEHVKADRSPVELTRLFIEALNARDVDALAALASAFDVRDGAISAFEVSVELTLGSRVV